MKSKFDSIELLFFNECPSWEKTHKLLKEVLKDLGIHNKILLVNVETDDEAKKTKFQGSPTVRINNKDIFPTNQTDYALGCRVYKTPEGLKGSPTREMIAEKIRSLI